MRWSLLNLWRRKKPTSSLQPLTAIVGVQLIHLLGEDAENLRSELITGRGIQVSMTDIEEDHVSFRFEEASGVLGTVRMYCPGHELGEALFRVWQAYLGQKEATDEDLWLVRGLIVNMLCTSIPFEKLLEVVNPFGGPMEVTLDSERGKPMLERRTVDLVVDGWFVLHGIENGRETLWELPLQIPVLLTGSEVSDAEIIELVRAHLEARIRELHAVA